MATTTINANTFILKQEPISGTTDANGNLLATTENSKKMILFGWDGSHVFIPFFYGTNWYLRVQQSNNEGTAFANQSVSCTIYYI